MSSRHDDESKNRSRLRSPPYSLINHSMHSTDDILSLALSSIPNQLNKHRSSTKTIDRSSVSRHRRQHRNDHHHHHHHQQQQQEQQQARIGRVQPRLHSSSSDDRTQANMISPMSSKNSSEIDDTSNRIASHQSCSRKKLIRPSQHISIVPTSSSYSMNQQQPVYDHSSTLRYASNGVLLRPKHQQQQYSTSIIQSSSNDTANKSKRFSLDAAENRSQIYHTVPNYGYLPESNISHSGITNVSSRTSNVYHLPTTRNYYPTNRIDSQSLSKRSTLQYSNDEINRDIPHRTHVSMIRFCRSLSNDVILFLDERFRS
jgi:hypothetical protein